MKNNQQISRDEVFDGVLIVLSSILDGKEAKIVPKNNITWDTDIYDDLGIDSLESLDFLSGLEERFKVNPDQYEANDKRKVSEIVDYILKLANEKPA